MKNLSFKE